MATKDGKFALVEADNKQAFEVVCFNDFADPNKCEVIMKSIDYNGFGDSGGTPIFDQINYNKHKTLAGLLVYKANRRIK